MRVTLAAHDRPPPADRVDRERGGVMIIADRYPSLVRADIIHPIRDRFGDIRVREVVDIDPGRAALGFPSPSAVGFGAVDQLFLLAVDRDHRLTSGDELTSNPVDVLELGVAVRMLSSFDGLSRRLQREPHPMQQLAHRPRRHLMTHVRQRRRQRPRGLQRPPQRRHRITPRVRLDQIIKADQQVRIDINQLRPTATLGPHSTIGFHPGDRGTLAVHHRVARHPRHPGSDRDTTPPEHPSHRPGLQPALLLIQMRTHEREELDQTLLGHLHTQTIPHPPPHARIVTREP